MLTARLVVMLIAASCAMFSSKAMAQSLFRDEVVLEGATGGRIIQKCEIIDFTGRGLSARIPMGSGRAEYAASEVLSVSTWMTESHAQAKAALEAGVFEETLDAGDRAVKEEARAWVRRDILALLVRCELRRGNLAGAAVRFLPITESDPDTPHIRLIPLQWDNAQSAKMSSGPGVWLRSKESLPRLIGASLLLTDLKEQRLAKETLDALTREPGEAVRQLAQWQLIRLRLLDEQVSDLDLDRWESRIERLDHRLRAGPYFLLGQACAIRGQHERAAAAFLQLPLVYDTDHPVTAEALFQATVSLDKIGQTAEAARLRSELQSRYSTSPAAIRLRVTTGDEPAPKKAVN